MPLAALLAAAPGALAQPAAGAASACSVRAQSTAVVVMVCPKGFDAGTIQAAATAACGARRECNVWVWDAESKAPAKAPQRDADLDKAQAATAIAVWANDSKSLMRLQRVGAPKSTP